MNDYQFTDAKTTDKSIIDVIYHPNNTSKNETSASYINGDNVVFKENTKPINEDLNQVFKEDRLNGSNSSEASSSYFRSDFPNQASIKTQPKNSQKTEAFKFINFISKQSPTPCEIRPIDIQGMEQSSSSNNLMTPAKCNAENTYHETKSERGKTADDDKFRDISRESSTYFLCIHHPPML
ncbi:Hypothetical predicted protein [Mytilus galloprovincialis]|uniref:Uncharacterized protein n=1 Tax=Mytilus galloprovincialis TaxID=29158 RepID=A0A8B6CWN6_MYTGA|nr:Hypothetical predicted protein [Mytilus galloprovincialis]